MRGAFNWRFTVSCGLSGSVAHGPRTGCVLPRRVDIFLTRGAERRMLTRMQTTGHQRRYTKEAVTERRDARQARLQAELDRIVAALRTRPDVREVLLFGSLATDAAGEQSDIELVVVQDTEKRFLERLDDIYRAVVPRVSVDILVYTPTEWEQLSREERFQQRIRGEGKVLYETPTD